MRIASVSSEESVRDIRRAVRSCEAVAIRCVEGVDGVGTRQREAMGALCVDAVWSSFWE